MARESYEAGLRAVKPGVRFGNVCQEMLQVVEKAGGWNVGPQIHGLNPLVGVCGCPSPQLGVNERYPHLGPSPTAGSDIVLEPGMSFAIEPSCGFGRRLVKLGGTIVVGDDGAVELNRFTAQVHRVNA